MVHILQVPDQRPRGGHHLLGKGELQLLYKVQTSSSSTQGKIPPLQKKEKIRSKQGWKGLKKERKKRKDAEKNAVKRVRCMQEGQILSNNGCMRYKHFSVYIIVWVREK
jgi:hypothetical protein